MRYAAVSAIEHSHITNVTDIQWIPSHFEVFHTVVCVTPRLRQQFWGVVFKAILSRCLSPILFPLSFTIYFLLYVKHVLSRLRRTMQFTRSIPRAKNIVYYAALQNRAGHYIFVLWFPLLILLSFLWSPYVIGQTIIFLPCSFFLLSSFFLLFFLA